MLTGVPTLLVPFDNLLFLRGTELSPPPRTSLELPTRRIVHFLRFIPLGRLSETELLVTFRFGYGPRFSLVGFNCTECVKKLRNISDRCSSSKNKKCFYISPPLRHQIFLPWPYYRSSWQAPSSPTSHTASSMEPTAPKSKAFQRSRVFLYSVLSLSLEETMQK